MHGNVGEWNEEMLVNATTGAPERVSRGGPYSNTAGYCAVSIKYRVAPAYRNHALGFRLARVPSREAKPVDLFAGGPALLKAPFTKGQADKSRAEWAKFLNVPERKELDLGKGVKLELVLIPPGQFRMGKEGNNGDQVAHDVTISKPFYMAATETTQEQYEAVLPGKRIASFSPLGGRRMELVGITDTSKFPMENVNWHEADAFCLATKAKLPTEAEWEYACRAGTNTEFHFGNSLNGTEANCDGTQPIGTPEKGPFIKRTVQVASYKANAFGLFDMHGNVSEWCRDWFADKTADLAERDPERTVDSMGHRMLRGGCWGFTDHCRSAHRYHHKPETRNFGWGFRVATPVPPPDVQAKNDEPKGVEIPVAGGPALLKAPFTKEQAEKARAEWAAYLKIPERKELVIGKGVKLPIVLIPPGEFMMGEGNKQRRVIISKPMYMATTETTQAQFQALLGMNPSGFAATGTAKAKVAEQDTSTFPVEKVDMNDALAFCDKIKAQLPTEAQWEYACRAGTTTAYHVGDDLTQNDANAGKTFQTVKAASYAPNAFGLYDMHGNVSEFCRDYYQAATNELSEKDPEQTVKSTDHVVIRGGSYQNGFVDCRSSRRLDVAMDSRHNNIGFRVVLPIATPVVPIKKDPPVEVKTLPKNASPIEKVLFANKLAELKIEDERFLNVKDGMAEGKPIFGDVPAWLQERTFHFKGKQAGYTQFTVEGNGIVLMAVSPRYKGGGNAGGNWKPDCISRDELLGNGWHEAGTLPIHSLDFPLYWRNCKKGETFKIRTEKYLAPVIIK